MKILLSGYHNPAFITITEYIENAIVRLGYGLTIFDDRRHLIPKRIRKMVSWLNELDLENINRNLITLCSTEKPDILIVTGGHRIKGKSIDRLKKLGIITVLWTTDAPLNFQPIIDVAPVYDHLFCQGSEAVELFNNAGIEGAHWLPMACDPFVHRPVELTIKQQEEYGSDVSFIGSYYQNRAELFEKLVDFDLSIWGPGWGRLSSHSPLNKCVKGAHLQPETWQKIYCASKIVLAPHFSEPNDLFPVYQASPRIFEALACGAFTISDNQRDVFKLFKDGVHLAKFHDSNHLIRQIEHYLDHPEHREYTSKQGQKEVLANHTYEHRINQMLGLIKKQ